MSANVRETVYSDFGEDESFTKDSLRHVADRLNLSAEEYNTIFDAVDSDNDGVITKRDLCTPSPSPRRKRREPVTRLPSLNSNEKIKTDLNVLSERK